MGVGAGTRPVGVIGRLMRRKQVDSTGGGSHKLKKELHIPELVAIGVGATIGAGVYVLVGTVASKDAGPALTISFLIAGIAAALSAFCYAELASRCPSAGSAYHYSYICVGEGVAWLIGWALILEYTIGGSAVARGISPNLAFFFGGQSSMPWFLARFTMPALGIQVDPCAAFLVLVVTALLCMGIKESTRVQGIITILNVLVMVFVIIVGSYLGFQTGWVGYKVTNGYFPFGVNGMLAGSATVFFAYIGFDAVASTAEEVKNPQRDLPWGIGLSLSICCFLYMLVSAVIVGLVPYFAMDPDTPISSAFAKHGLPWAMYVVTTGAVLALCSTLMGSILPQPRILLAMARDGLLPSFFSDVDSRTQVPLKGTIVTGVFAALLAFFLKVDDLAGMVSVGTLLAFTIVAVSILILRYIPPGTLTRSDHAETEDGNQQSSKWKATEEKQSLICKQKMEGEDKVRNFLHLDVPTSISSVCAGAVLLTGSASAGFLSIYVQCVFFAVGCLLFIWGLFSLLMTPQANLGKSTGEEFTCPFVPVLPVFCMLINTYLLINLGLDTWMRVSVWLLIGVLIYAFYGQNHSSLGRSHPEAGTSSSHAILA